MEGCGLDPYVLDMMFTAVTMGRILFWNVKPCNPVDVDRRNLAYCLYLQG
jgi:hypothetical protein